MNRPTLYPLYKETEIPNSKASRSYQEQSTSCPDGDIHVRQVTVPTLEVFRPEGRNTHMAVIICPGGGYCLLSYINEGVAVAKMLSSWGITAIVLKYRLPSDLIMPDKKLGPLQDAQKAIEWTRQQAATLDIDPDKVGIMGFSAGGHLAACASTLFERPVINSERLVSLRPDFSLLIYPVISMQSRLSHEGCLRALLGDQPKQADIERFSGELQVTAQTPPTFLALSGDDLNVAPANSLRYYEALHKKGVSAELHIYQKGGHGYGLKGARGGGGWPACLKRWLQVTGLIAL